jgi:hypothetical protein
VAAMMSADQFATADLGELGQRTTQVRLEQVSVPSGGPSPLWGLALSLLLALAVVAVSLLPSKRGHQD